jgi:hypothetical protein
MSDEFKSWDAKFKFTHYSAGNITLKRSFKFDKNEITSRFILRPLFIYEYSQKSSLVLEGNKVKTLFTRVKNNVPGSKEKSFEVSFLENRIESKDLAFSFLNKENVLDQLGSDLQMRLNVKNGVDNFFLNVITNTEGKIAKRQYEVIGEEIIEKKFGNINCIIVKATSDEAGDITYYISPEYDFMIIESFIELRNGKINKLSLVEEPKFLEE